MELNKNIEKATNLILGLPKTIIFNIKYFGLKGLRLPILVSKNVKIKRLSGKVILNSANRILLGFGTTPNIDCYSQKSIWHNEGTVVFEGGGCIEKGSKIVVGKDGIFTFGKQSRITGNSTIICHKNISIGDRTWISWDCLIMDTDHHKIITNNERINYDESITIGDNVWICAKNTILKGTLISNNSILGSNSKISSKIENENVLIAGNPAKVVKKNITWQL